MTSWLIPVIFIALDHHYFLLLRPNTLLPWIPCLDLIVAVLCIFLLTNKEQIASTYSHCFIYLFTYFTCSSIHHYFFPYSFLSPYVKFVQKPPKAFLLDELGIHHCWFITVRLLFKTVETLYNAEKVLIFDFVVLVYTYVNI